MKRFYLLFIALLFAATACQKDRVIYYNDITFVNAVDGVYTTDYGLNYIVVDNTSGKELPRDGRIIFQSDILKARRDGSYEVRVTNFAVPLTKDPIPAGEGPEADDPLNIENGWFSGGYFNTLLGLYIKDESSVKHLINTEYTLPTETNDTLYLRLRHNALGECPVDPDDEEDEYSYAHTYACFHLEGLLPEGSQAPLKITWKWYGEKEGDVQTFVEYKYITNLHF